MLVMPLRITQVDTKVLVFLVHTIMGSLLHIELQGPLLTARALDCPRLHLLACPG